ncbi:MAG TPA: cofactor-independent phosphoglycerate mutase [Clostridiales bacterium]|nr:cofactor-independent phosphoglycerate mutase [Clostridiales bacterium]
MKYLVLLGDGMADVPNAEIGGLTPIEKAHTPNIDKIAKKSQVGLVQSIPKGMKPGSDVANLSILGYDPKKYYSGRSPLEALAIGVDLKDGDVAIRTNLVTLSDGDWDEKVMLDYSADEISTAEAKQLIEEIQKELGNDKYHFYAGFSYRHCLVVSNGTTKTTLTPPHDISKQKVGDKLPKGEGGKDLAYLIKASEKILKNHPVNIQRIKEGKNPATHIWFWGAGTKPQLDSFEEKYGLKGAIISAVDLLKGIAVGAKMKAPYVENATGTINTNWKGKVEAVKQCFDSGIDYVYLHMEAPDECGHQGDLENKIRSIEKIDWVTGELYDYLKSKNEPFVLVLTPDHATPLDVMTHTSTPIPYMIYKSYKELDSDTVYSEKAAQNGVFLHSGSDIMKTMLAEKDKNI